MSGETTTALPEEVPVFIPGRREALGAVVTIPPGAAEAEVGVVLMSGRARPRAHTNGLWVRIAAALAERGMYVLRLDYPGVGNSSGPRQIFDLERPPSWAIEDACRFLIETTPVRRLLLVGSCFGGRVVLDAAPRIPEVAAVAVSAAPAYTRTSSLQGAVKRRLRRLFRRPEPVLYRGAAGQQRREGGLAIEHRVSRGFARGVARCLDRGRVYFLYGQGDFVTEELEFALERLDLPRERMEVDLVPWPLHSFRSLPVQELAEERLVDWCVRAGAVSATVEA